MDSQKDREERDFTDKELAENGITPADHSDFPDSLCSYLRQLGDYPPLSSEQQLALGREIDEAAGKFRAGLFYFGFAAAEHLRRLDGVIARRIDPADCFLPSCLGTAEQSEQFLDGLPVLHAGIKKIYLELQNSFAQKRSCAAIRKKMSAALAKAEFNGDVLEEYFEVFCRYLRMIDENFRLEKQYVLPVDKASPEVRKHIEERFLMPLEELAWQLTEMAELYDVLEKLRQRMIESNLRLVISVAQRYRNRGVQFGDLIQEGNIGLVRAIKKFDFRVGTKFSTYASWWIRHSITRSIAEQSRVIRIPAHMIHTINAMRWAEQRFIQRNGREPDAEELAALLEVPVARISAIRKMACQTISLQSPVGPDGDGTLLEDLIADDNGNADPVQDLARRMLYDRLYQLLGTLSERNQQIIISRFGLFNQPRLPLEELSKHFQLTRERVRQLEVKIIKNLRSPANLKFLDGEDGCES